MELSSVEELSDLHEVPWSELEGAHVRVKVEQKVNGPVLIGEQPEYEYREREGDVAGRMRGWHVYYDRDHGDVPTVKTPTVVLDTPEDTYLEVSTNRAGNELLEINP